MPEHKPTVVAHPGWVWGMWWVVFPLLGAGAAELLRLAVGWVAGLPAVPLPGWLRLAVTGVPEPWVTIGAVALGVTAGLVVAWHAQHDSLAVTVSGSQVELTRRGATTRLARGEVGVAFVDDKQLVLLGRAGEELAREPSDLEHAALERAFAGHGYRWHRDGDPYRDDYRRWVPETPDLPPAVNALLKARERTLAKGDGEDAAELRTELGKLGIVVREEKTRQYWRRAGTGVNPDPG